MLFYTIVLAVLVVAIIDRTLFAWLCPLQRRTVHFRICKDCYEARIVKQIKQPLCAICNVRAQDLETILRKCNVKDYAVEYSTAGLADTSALGAPNGC